MTPGNGSDRILLDLTPEDLARLVGRPLPTPEQAAAIAAPLGPGVVEAGAGSGKTETMASRVVWLVATGRVPPDRVLGLTFTRKAAAELAARIRTRLAATLSALSHQGIVEASGVEAMAAAEPAVLTYHSYAARLLTEHAARGGVEPASRLAGEAACWQLARSVVDGWDGPLEKLDLAPSTVTDLVLRLAAELGEHFVSPDTLERRTRAMLERMRRLPRDSSTDPAVPGAPYADTLRFLERQEARLALLPVVAEYILQKRSSEVVDHGDQVSLAAAIARDHPEVGRRERERYSAVLLDEYQDTSPAQDLLLRNLFGQGHPMTAVGDPVQAIYGWRGASAGAMERFARDYTYADGRPPDHFRLGTSFRNAGRILAVANTMSRGLATSGEGLVSGTGQEGDVTCALFPTVEEEARWIAAEAARLVRGGLPPSEIAVLVRKRALMRRIAQALADEGIALETAALGGLLDQPEVADVVATLRCLVDPDAGAAVARLLTGPRWRLGPRDLMALGERARTLARSTDPASTPSLVEAVEDPGAQSRYSPAARTRLRSLRSELRHLRRFVDEPLGDLVNRVIATTGWDVEAAALPDRPPNAARAHLDRLVSVAAEFAGSAEGAPLSAFLDYLDAAEERESGLEPGAAHAGPRPADGRATVGARQAVQLGTVHAAKGLEWTAVFVAGLTKDVFPDGRPSATWLTDLGGVPVDLRGDATDLPVWRGSTATTQKALRDELLAHRADWRSHDLREERRLGYVAVTRARRWLRCSGSWWTEGTSRPRGPSMLLEEIRETCRTVFAEDAVDWATEPDPADRNPLSTDPRSVTWPMDPLGSRRADVEAGAAMVRAAKARIRASAAPDDPILAGDPGVGDPGVGDPGAGGPGAEGPGVEGPGAEGPGVGGTWAQDPWAQDVAVVLTDLRERRARSCLPVDVPLPDHLSVSDLVGLARDPAELARRIRRPMPAAPSSRRGRGTAFHAWLEERFAVAPPLDFDGQLPFDEIPGRDPDLDRLVGAFLASRWADRVPVEVEVPFDTLICGIPVRGRIDAVFAEPGETWLVVDWKTGLEPRGTPARSAAVQLAVYRAAWAQLSGAPLDSVGAAFHYVRTGRTVRAADDLDLSRIEELLTGLPQVTPS